MEINDIISGVRMENFYFNECRVTRACKIENGKLHYDFKKNIKKEDDNTYNVEIIFKCYKEDFNIKTDARATFIFDENATVDKDAIINTNAIAIMFPYIRTQITLLSSQPNMMPVVLPVININNLK